MYRATLRELEIRPVAYRPAISARAGAHTFGAAALADLGRWPEARQEAELAMPFAQEFGDTTILGQVHLTLGRAHAALGAAADARTDLTLALALLKDTLLGGVQLAQTELAALES